MFSLLVTITLPYFFSLYLCFSLQWNIRIKMNVGLKWSPIDILQNLLCNNKCAPLNRLVNFINKLLWYLAICSCFNKHDIILELFYIAHRSLNTGSNKIYTIISINTLHCVYRSEINNTFKLLYTVKHFQIFAAWYYDLYWYTNMWSAAELPASSNTGCQLSKYSL